MRDLYFVIGATNAGKSTFLQAVKAACGNRAGLVEVGKWMRAKYPPAHFAGQGAPTNTAAEAWNMLVDGVMVKCADAEFVLIDGQPRDLGQCAGIVNQFREPEFSLAFIHLYAPVEERRDRAMNRDTTNRAALDLSLARVVGDMAPMYEVTSWLTSSHKDRFFTLNTAVPGYDPYSAFVNIRSVLDRA